MFITINLTVEEERDWNHKDGAEESVRSIAKRIRDLTGTRVEIDGVDTNYAVYVGPWEGVSNVREGAAAILAALDKVEVKS